MSDKVPSSTTSTHQESDLLLDPNDFRVYLLHKMMALLYIQVEENQEQTRECMAEIRDLLDKRLPPVTQTLPSPNSRPLAHPPTPSGPTADPVLYTAPTRQQQPSERTPPTVSSQVQAIQQQIPEATAPAVSCFLCGTEGHVAFHCPHKRGVKAAIGSIGNRLLANTLASSTLTALTDDDQGDKETAKSNQMDHNTSLVTHRDAPRLSRDEVQRLFDQTARGADEDHCYMCTVAYLNDEPPDQLDILINNTPATAVVSTGTSTSIVPESLLPLNYQKVETVEQYFIRSMDGSLIPVLFHAVVNITVGPHTTPMMVVVPQRSITVLGTNWLRQAKVTMSMMDGTFSVSFPGDPTQYYLRSCWPVLP
ncbi:hypothetical protein IWQ62_004416 [Dispira parvispora]|uniref:CCHC-type domain-containing protein n=1 Tax=Dispira parvispora TaxID=1520584 RepID=A0A9W8ARW6_9FUNG|nr:hypothetical protein IWQ62_004416 [Dispira parvispora]